MSSLFGAKATEPSNPVLSPSIFGIFGGPKPPRKEESPSDSPSGATFGPNAISQPQQSSSLFGMPTTTIVQPSGSLFGQTGSNTTTQPSSSLFGSTLGGGPQQTQSQPQQTGSVFGSAFGQNQNTQSTPSAFANLSSLSKPPTTSLFGNSASNQQQEQPKSSLFGSTAPANTTTAQPSLFGTSTAAAQPQQGASLFGNNQRPGLQLGQTLNQQQPASVLGQGNTIPGVRIDVSNVRGTTRFNDLHDDLQNQIAQIDTFIQQQINFSEQCTQLMPNHGDTIASIPTDVSYVKQILDTTELALDNDSTTIEDMKAIVRQDADNARLSFRAVENLKLPQQFHYGNAGLYGNSTAHISQDPSAAPEDIVGYFSRTAEDFQKTLDSYTRNISEIEAHLRTLETNVVQQSQQMLFRRGTNGEERNKDEQVRELVAVLNEFERAIVGVAERIGEAREGASSVIEAGRDGQPKGAGNRWRR